MSNLRSNEKIANRSFICENANSRFANYVRVALKVETTNEVQNPDPVASISQHKSSLEIRAWSSF